ncbi:hypothetical protein Syun_029720 [Stephania yunnanensis]|uniref:Uncharacterized protein n=1 Tax=Stephania yunnanensis TaxID=152371 RepID=A0AAP0E655_9MAGN
MVHASSSSSTPLLPLSPIRPKKKKKKTTPRPPSSISSSSSSPIRLLHRRIATAVFADSPKEQGQNQSPLRRFADSSSSSDSSSPIRDLSAEEYIATAATPHRRGVRRSDSTKRLREARRRSQISCARGSVIVPFVSFWS